MYTLIKIQGLHEFYYCRDTQWHPSAELNAVIKPIIYRTDADARKAWERIGKPAMVFVQEIKSKDKTLLQ
ncbi:MAG: hypothetical protein EBR30_08500 [Cytophagia bacterium]|jgi:hypothetical protein|nr:hypothetical protein [Cytophagia bacterium]NBW35044.1 hypothetical protein [Cytophagia bacterium]